MVAKYTIACRCGQKMQVEARQAGEQIGCACGQQIDVPTLRGLALLPQVEVQETARDGWTRVRGVCFVVGIVWIALGLAVTWRFWSLAQQPVEVLKFDQVAHDLSGRIERLTPSESFTYWRMFRDQPSGMLTGAQRADGIESGNQSYLGRTWAALAATLIGVGILGYGLLSGRKAT